MRQLPDDAMGYAGWPDCLEGSTVRAGRALHWQHRHPVLPSYGFYALTFGNNLCIMSANANRTPPCRAFFPNPPRDRCALFPPAGRRGPRCHRRNCPSRHAAAPRHDASPPSSCPEHRNPRRDPASAPAAPPVRGETRATRLDRPPVGPWPAAVPPPAFAVPRQRPLHPGDLPRPHASGLRVPQHARGGLRSRGPAPAAVRACPAHRRGAAARTGHERSAGGVCHPVGPLGLRNHAGARAARAPGPRAAAIGRS